MAYSELVRHITGAGQFTDDLEFGGAAHGYVLRSPHAHAKLNEISIKLAEARPGVIAIFTAADLEHAGVGSIPCTYPVEQVDGSPMAAPPHHPLALDSVRHVGDAVVFVVAESLAAAMDAAESIEIDYAPMPSVTDAKAALLPSAPVLWPEAPNNVCFEWEMGDAAETDAAFASAARVVSRDITFPRCMANTLETRCAVAAPNADGLTVYTPSQGVKSLRDQLAGVLGCSEDELHVVTPDVGGAFGLKAQLYPEQILVAHAARRLGRPVRWVAERSTGGFLGDSHARDLAYRAELALSGQGSILALRMHTVANLGAYLSSFAPGNSTIVQAISGHYEIPVAYVNVTGVFTNTLPMGSYRGAARAEYVFPVERIIDEAAHELGADPAEFRRRNFARSAGVSRTNCMGLEVDGDDYERCLDLALEQTDWPRRKSRRAASRSRGRLHGVGLACYATIAQGYEETVRLEVDSGGLVSVLVGTQSGGQGHEDVFCGIVAKGLSIDRERVRLIQGDTRRFPRGMGTSGSRSMAAAGPACRKAARALIERAREVAAALIQTDPENVAYARGMIRCEETETDYDLQVLVALAAEAGLADGGADACLAVEACHDPGNLTFPTGAHVCELEVDPETGKVHLLSYVSVDDAGLILTPELALGQIHGGVAQGMGQAMLEVCRYDPENGQLLSGSFLDYALPRADDLPFFRASFIEQPDDAPLRGLGEMGTIASTPAIMNAIIDALRQLGVKQVDMPTTPESIWRVCRDSIVCRGSS